MKKIFLLLMMAFSNMSILAYDFVVDGIAYNITSASNRTVEVTYNTFTRKLISSLNDATTYEYINDYVGNINVPAQVVFFGDTYTVTSIGYNAFGSYLYYSDLHNTSNNHYIYHATNNKNLISITIPETITSIGANAFGCCSGLTTLVLPNSLESIGEYAFSGCSALTDITLPNSLKAIGGHAFDGCRALSPITLPSSVESIGISAFNGCSITKLIVPSTVTSIGSYAFPTSLRALIMLPYNPPSGYSGVTSSSTEVLVPSKDKYLNASDWSSRNLIEMLTPTSRSFEYNGQVPTIEWTNNLNGYTMNVSDFTLQKEAGTHSIDVKADFYKDDELEFSVEFPYEYTINKATLNAKVNNASREYGEENSSFNVTYSGFVNDENESVITTGPTFTTTATKTSDVGEYPITASGGEATNYDFVYEPGVLTVTKAPLSAMVNDATKVYGANNPSFTINYSGLRNEETVPAWTTPPTFQTEATKQSGVGQYTVNAIDAIPMNYELGEITSGTLTITPAPLTIKANNVTKQYYNENPTLKYTCSGFMNSDNESVLSPTPTLSTTATQSSNVGTYEISVEGASSPNYSVSHVNGTLTITPRTLKASVGNYSRLYNEGNPEFEVMYDGFVGNEDKSVLTVEPVAITTATETSNVGTYKINVSGGSADNYTFSYTSGTLTINKAEQTIAWNQDLSNLNVGDQVELQAVASSGLPITYTMDNNSVAEIYSTGNRYYLDCLAEGQFIIRAVQNGNSNYYSSPRASKAVTIIGATPPSDPTLTINQADNGTISIQVSRGRTYTFTIAPNYGWKIHTVMFNNTDVTSQLRNDYKYTTPAINTNSWLSVVYESIDEDAIASVAESNVKIQGTSFGARVLDAELGEMIRVYTTDGKLQHSLMVDSSSVDVPLENDNIYIIQVGTKTVKLGH